jgi:hypothetical protein
MQYLIRDECSRARGAQISPVRDLSAPGSNPSQDSNSNASQVSNGVNAIVEALAETVGPSEYRIQFKRPTTLTCADAHPKVRASSLFIASWIKDHFLNEISLTVRTVTERLLKKLGTTRLGLKTLTLLKEENMK